jgi:hypothetical protein
MEEDRIKKIRDKIYDIFLKADMDAYERYDTVINRMNLTPDQVADIFNFILFDELEFETHPYDDEAVWCNVEFDNDNYISIVGGGSTMYGNGTTTFEIKSTFTDMTEEGVIAYATIDKLNHHLILLQI